MNFEESKNFKIESSSLKEVRVFARDIFKKSSVFENDTDDLVLALAEAAQNIVKHGYNNEPTEDEMRIIIKFKENVLSILLSSILSNLVKSFIFFFEFSKSL